MTSTTPTSPTASLRRTTMATPVTPMAPRKRPRPRVSGPVRRVGAEREAEYDLLTAALIGAAIGAGITYALRRGPSGARPLTPMLREMGRGASWAGQRAAAG